jgi:nucleotide-binding universal stress UspA family protein
VSNQLALLDYFFKSQTFFPPKEVSLMNRVRKILVPVNFSDDSANGLNYAASLAEETQAELVVLHVTPKEEARFFLNFLAAMEGWPMPNNPTAIPLDRLVREKALDLYRFIEKVIRNPGRVKIRRKVALGHEEEKNFRGRSGRKYRSRRARHAK